MELKEPEIQPVSPSTAISVEQRQRRRMLAALALLLAALLVVLIKDRQFWMSSATPAEPVADEAPVAAMPSSPSATPQPDGNVSKPATAVTKSAAASAVRKKVTSKHSVAPTASPQLPSSESAVNGGAMISATNRTVLPPLQIEVVAGNQHRPLAPKNNSVKVDMDSSASFTPPSTTPPEQVAESQPMREDASANVTVPAATAQRVSRSVKPEYPVLAKQMKVQGAVVLQALIDKGGRIEELHVVTGPAILATAAQEAVKQWRFKPYYQQGQAVETEARITVNFTISTF
jgi:TonB family protein